MWLKRRGAVYAFSPDLVALVIGALLTGLILLFLV